MIIELLLLLLANALIISGYQPLFSFPKTNYYKWIIAEESIVSWEKDIKLITINGKFPGPTIEVNSYDTIIVDVTNNLDRDLTIHWHGMLQKGTVISDGVPYVTQDPIKPNASYRYEYHVTDQAGTWYYHAHTGLDSEQLFGPLIVRDQPNIYNDLINYDNQFNYDEEKTIVLSEMRIKSSVAMVQGLKSAPFKWVGNPDYILTNGKSFNYNNNTNHTIIGNNKFNNGYQVIKVEQYKRYRIRFVGALEVMSLAFIIPNHKITLIEVEGTYIEPYQVSEVQINPGQRVSIILETDQPVDNYMMCAKSLGSKDSTCDSGLSILHYKGAEDYKKLQTTFYDKVYQAPPITRYEKNYSTNKWYLKRKLKHFYNVPLKVNRNIYFKVAEASDSNKAIYFTMDGKRVSKDNNTLWTEVVDRTYVPDQENTQGIVDIREGDNVQIVIEHFAMRNNSTTCIVHPWHLHGHSYYVVGYGSNNFTIKDQSLIDQNLRHSNKIPILRDTFTHYPGIVDQNSLEAKSSNFNVPSLKVAFSVNQDFTAVKPNININSNPDEYISCGWYAIRFTADNPGSWFMHCHITPHLIMGKFHIINELPRNYHRNEYN